MRCERCGCTLFSCQCPTGPSNPLIEKIPDDCLPPAAVIEKLLRGPELDAQGRIVGGTYDGMTPAEVLAERDRFNRYCPGKRE